MHIWTAFRVAGCAGRRLLVRLRGVLGGRCGRVVDQDPGVGVDVRVFQLRAARRRRFSARTSATASSPVISPCSCRLPISMSWSVGSMSAKRYPAVAAAMARSIWASGNARLRVACSGLFGRQTAVPRYPSSMASSADHCPQRDNQGNFSVGQGSLSGTDPWQSLPFRDHQSNGTLSPVRSVQADQSPRKPRCDSTASFV